MSNTILRTQTAVHMWVRNVKGRIRNSEHGQGSAEYAGVIVVAVILVVALGSAASGWGSTMVSNISLRIAKIFSNGG